MGLQIVIYRLIFAHYGLSYEKVSPIFCFSHDGLYYGKSNSIMGKIFCEMELWYGDHGLIFLTWWGFVFPMIACTMGNIFPKWIKYFEVGFSLCWLWAFIFYIMELCFADVGLSYGKNNSIMGSIFWSWELVMMIMGLFFYIMDFFPMMACTMRKIVLPLFEVRGNMPVWSLVMSPSAFTVDM